MECVLCVMLYIQMLTQVLFIHSYDTHTIHMQCVTTRTT